MSGTRAAAVVALAVAVVLAPPGAGAQAEASERIERYSVEMAVQEDGTLAVTETIDYQFGAEPHHGIYRDIPVRERYDDERDRRYPIDGVAVSSPTGAPAQTRVSDEGGTLRIRIGSPDETVTGAHTYVISYRVHGALNAFDDRDELYWDAVGTYWDVPVRSAHVVVTAPAAVTRVACFSGWEGTDEPCPDARLSDGQASFSAVDLGSNEGLTVVAALPKGAVAEPEPILEDRDPGGDAFDANWIAGLGAALSTGVAGTAIWQVLRRGRDERWTGSAVDAAFGNPTGEVERVGLLERPDGPVEFVPPDGIRPGEVGTLLDERANPIDVSASIVDLAVRGYLRIEELERTGVLSRRPDYRLVRLREPGSELRDYERVLLEGLFRDGAEVELSDLKYEFASRLKEVQSALYDDVVARGWFRKRPDHDRTKAALTGVLVAAAGVGLTFLLAARTRYALAGLPLVLGGIVLLALAGRAPARAAAGRAMYGRVLGFRQLFEAGELDRARFAEQQHLFTDYLPYALVFGLVGRWAQAFEGLALEQAATGWYVAPHAFTALVLADSLDDVATTSAGTLSVTQSTSSSGGSGFSGGFSGGGGGGGGGGSW
jgi:uncharacterized membrane protein